MQLVGEQERAQAGLVGAIDGFLGARVDHEGHDHRAQGGQGVADLAGKGAGGARVGHLNSAGRG